MYMNWAVLDFIYQLSCSYIQWRVLVLIPVSLCKISATLKLYSSQDVIYMFKTIIKIMLPRKNGRKEKRNAWKIE